MTDIETAVTNCNGVTDRFNLIFYFILNIFMITKLAYESARTFQTELLHGLSFSN
jgi:hypothetical protein